MKSKSKKSSTSPPNLYGGKNINGNKKPNNNNNGKQLLNGHNNNNNNTKKNDYIFFTQVVKYWAIPIAICCLIAETVQPTMYGKFSDVSKYTVSPRVGWWIMELPCSTVFLYKFWLQQNPSQMNKTQLVLGTMFSLHYVYRGWLYPWVVLNVHPESKGFDVMSAFGSWVVTITHAYLNASWIGKWGKFKTSYLNSFQFFIGLLLYYGGLALIIQQDLLMQSARNVPNAPRYSIPRGGLWEYSTSAQYLAELIAWFGWCTINNFGPNGLFIFFVSLFNLVPRAETNFVWYTNKFGDEFTQLGRARLVPGVW
jgi:hypothetical protein